MQRSIPQVQAHKTQLTGPALDLQTPNADSSAYELSKVEHAIYYSEAQNLPFMHIQARSLPLEREGVLMIHSSVINSGN